MPNLKADIGHGMLNFCERKAERLQNLSNFQRKQFNVFHAVIMRSATDPFAQAYLPAHGCHFDKRGSQNASDLHSTTVPISCLTVNIQLLNSRQKHVEFKSGRWTWNAQLLWNKCRMHYSPQK